MSGIYDETEVRYSYRKLTRLLIERKLTISTMESVTAGLIASLITDTEGASSVLKGAFITYCNEAKVMQGVPQAVIDSFSVYSEETAQAMARACAAAYGADIGIGVTGTAGNTDPANPDFSVPGRVFFAISVNGDVRSRSAALRPQLDRLAFKLAVAKVICDELLQRLESRDIIG